MKPILIRKIMGETLRELRVGAGLTLREVSAASLVSLGYLSEIERGHKEASSEVLFSVAGALDVPMSDLLRMGADKISLVEASTERPRVTLAA